MGNLTVGEDGKLDVGSVNSLSRDELTNWMRLRLHGRDHLVPSDIKQAEPSYYLLASIYPSLERDSRSYMRSAVEQFLNEMAQGDASWHGDAAHSLLLLAQDLNEREFVAPIKRMAEDSLFFDDAAGRDIDAIHYRLLQSLVALRWRGAPAFWHTQFERSSTTYAAVVFAGLNMISIHHAMLLLRRVPWEDANTRRGMRVALRGLLPAYDHTVISIELSRILRALNPSHRSIVENMLPEVRGLGRPLVEPPRESTDHRNRSTRTNESDKGGFLPRGQDEKTGQRSSYNLMNPSILGRGGGGERNPDPSFDLMNPPSSLSSQTRHQEAATK